MGNFVSYSIRIVIMLELTLAHLNTMYMNTRKVPIMHEVGRREVREGDNDKHEREGGRMGGR